MTVYRVLCKSNISWKLQCTFTTIYVLHVEERVCRKQVCAIQTNCAILIKVFGEVAKCWLQHDSYQFPASDMYYTMVMAALEKLKWVSSFKNQKTLFVQQI